MLKLFTPVVLTSFILAACSGGEQLVQTQREPQEETASKGPTIEAAHRLKEKKTESVPQVDPSFKTSMTKEEFDKMFKLDSNEKQYPNGKFELKDGSIIYADYMLYDENDIFGYSIAKFYNGKLAHLQIETDKPIEEIFEGLGLTMTKEIMVDPSRIGYEIIFDQTFHDNNIARFPNEWD